MNTTLKVLSFLGLVFVQCSFIELFVGVVYKFICDLEKCILVVSLHVKFYSVVVLLS